MNRKPGLITFILVLCAVGHVAVARPRPGRGKRFEANKVFGAGLELGAPTGLNGKYFFQSDRAIDFGLGWDDYYGYRDGFNLYADYLWHPLSLASLEPFELPLYFGIGARIWDFNDPHNDDRGVALGARVPLGISFDFNNQPFDIYVQLVFVADFFIDYGPHSFYPGLEGGVGVRYWFE
ncbi:MAG TPA: hypothetical protein VGM88_34810 [Kofleriaceae bacterium]|jgi:hypothetical protein